MLWTALHAGKQHVVAVKLDPLSMCEHSQGLRKLALGLCTSLWAVSLPRPMTFVMSLLMISDRPALAANTQLLAPVVCLAWSGCILCVSQMFKAAYCVEVTFPLASAPHCLRQPLSCTACPHCLDNRVCSTSEVAGYLQVITGVQSHAALGSHHPAITAFCILLLQT